MPDIDPPFISQLNDLLDRQLDSTDFSIDQACRELGVSRSQLYRLVKEQEGISLSLYFRKRRMLKAEFLLRTTGLRVSDIAHAVGMDSPQTFSKYFTQEFGISPSDYRKNRLELIEGVSESTPVEVPMRSSLFRRFRWGILTVLMGGTLLAWIAITLLNRPGAPIETTIAVLPFAYRGTPADSLLAEGLGDQIHASLASLEGLNVISRRSSGMFRNSTKRLPEIAHALGVNHLLLGTVTLRAGTIEVNVELVKALDDRTLWARKFKGTLNASIGFMNTAARDITSELNQRLSADESRRPVRKPTANPQAYSIYLRARQLAQSRSREKLLASLELYDKALALDTAFADALANRAVAHNLLLSYGGSEGRKYLGFSERDALAAIRLDSQNATAYAALANGYWLQGKWEQALTTFEIALRHSPNDAYVTYLYSILLRSLGRFDEAIHYGDRAVLLDPLYPTVLAGHIGNYSYAGRFDEAWRLIREYESSLRDFHVYYYVRGFYYLNRQEPQNALREFTKAVSMNSDLAEYRALVAYCRGRLGDTAAAEELLLHLPDTPEQHGVRTILYAGLGDADHCLRYIRLSATQGVIPEYLKVSPLYVFLHPDPRFGALLRELGLDTPRP
ncbi:MAG: helix-turn-helix domain-containing protein [Bacteroidetes bacterium]|nr:helix-turn-helix domain-containing protein [Bacteroidota bacterium]